MKVINTVFTIIFLLQITAINAQSNFIEYIEEESKALSVPAESFFYVSVSSKEKFIENMQPALIAFVKGNLSTSIDEIEGHDEQNGVVNLNSSCSVQQLSKEHILNHLNDKKSYEGIVIKNIRDQKPITFNEDQIVALVLYSSKLRPFMDQYLAPLKKLKEEENIPYIILTMDLEDIKGLPDLYQNSVFEN
ncbi:MAG: hypothetical protein WDZ45_04450 [Flavobacteriaceae bacterium]